ncbi:phospholipid-binding lipoprotein MlaA [Shimia gijangensis]|uniref:Phospholipid-binding lipoprotein MlaA n=1 Tax=Shimia gijangensis TaxID=1470563 RepID=A0A1M6BQI5_9RHOB|nr:VacJ family lipoprotein [Shimia gijangensis]SHI50951.1 phospholipid-binding lipoprotein MlaA [Shimia gijangensis]
MSHIARPALALAFVLGVAGCATEQVNLSTGGIYDPYEDNNRRTHQFNKDLDRLVVAPMSNGYGKSTSDGLREVFGNFASHLALPNDVINNVLQGELDAAVQNTGRFAMNTIVGFAGFFDPASDVGMSQIDADFGQTLHVWGFAEGPYVEMPFLGPSNSRDSIGVFVDIALNPFIVILQDPQQYVGIFAYILDSMGDRYEYDTVIDSILYQSADSYAQTRSIYLQNRRYQLGMSAEDLYLDPYSDDPYEDF